MELLDIQVAKKVEKVHWSLDWFGPNVPGKVQCLNTIFFRYKRMWMPVMLTNSEVISYIYLNQFQYFYLDFFYLFGFEAVLPVACWARRIRPICQFGCWMGRRSASHCLNLHSLPLWPNASFASALRLNSPETFCLRSVVGIDWLPNKCANTINPKIYIMQDKLVKFS